MEIKFKKRTLKCFKKTLSSVAILFMLSFNLTTTMSFYPVYAANETIVNNSENVSSDAKADENNNEPEEKDPPKIDSEKKSEEDNTNSETDLKNETKDQNTNTENDPKKSEEENINETKNPEDTNIVNESGDGEESNLENPEDKNKEDAVVVPDDPENKDENNNDENNNGEDATKIPRESEIPSEDVPGGEILPEVVPETIIPETLAPANGILEEIINMPLETTEEIVPEELPIWGDVSDGKATTTGPVVLGVEYVSPQNSDVKIVFTKLPDNPGTLSIEEIKLTDKQVQETGAVSDSAYDITSDMKDGTFEYSLTLPKPKNAKDVQIKYSEDISELQKAKIVSEDDMKIKDDSVSATLDHFTVFVVAGPNSASVFLTTPGSYNVWLNPENSKVSDDVYTTQNIWGSTQFSPYFDSSDFKFNIPSNATILGITVNVEKHGSSGVINDGGVRIIQNGSTYGYKSSSSSWPSSDAVSTYGGSSDLWGLSWTPADINNSNFGFGISTFVSQPNLGGVKVAYIDYIGIEVNYSMPDPDIIPPVISAHGDVIAEATGPSGAVVNYSLPTATDNVDPTVTVICTPAPGMTFAFGTTLVTCNATDAAGNNAVPVTFNVIVQDNTIPIITLLGTSPVDVVFGTTYTDAGATASDNIDGNITANIITVNPVNTSIVGTYTVTYNVTDAAGNAATQVTRTVNVIPKSVTVTVNPGQTKVYGDMDPILTYTASDPFAVFSGSITRDAGENVGTYAITQGTLSAGLNYSITFISDNFSITSRPVEISADDKVKIIGTPDPIFTYQIISGTLVGTDSFSGSLTRDPGEAIGTYAITLGTVSLSTNYILSYMGADLSIVTGSIPVIDVHADVTVEATSPAGAIVNYTAPNAVDVEDGIFPATCSPASGSTFAIGTTVVTCNATDASGNAAIPTVFNVIVQDTIAPSTPVETPVAGNYMTSQSVTLSSTDSGSGLDKIYFTLDGSNPDNTKTVYTGAITVDHDLTIKAIAYDLAGNANGILTATYGIAPAISLEAASSVVDTTAIITWITNYPATSRVIYDVISHPILGLAPNYGYVNSTIETDTLPMITNHSVALSGLAAGTTYYYRVISHGSPEAVSNEFSFATIATSVASSGDGGGGGGGHHHSHHSHNENNSSGNINTQGLLIASSSLQPSGPQADQQVNQDQSGMDNQIQGMVRGLQVNQNEDPAAKKGRLGLYFWLITILVVIGLGWVGYLFFKKKP